MATSIKKSEFGKLNDGQSVDLFTLRNAKGFSVKISSLGASVVAIEMADKHGTVKDIVLGYDTPQEYLEGRSYIGAMIGRYANRIAGSRFVLDGREYSLPKNDGENHLHGGSPGFDKRLWQSEIIGETLRFTLLSEDGDQGYPGNLKASVEFSLDDDNALHIDCRANCDKRCPVSLTHHGYFNLAGEGDILDHEAQIFAEEFTELAGGVPNGVIAKVEESPFDFRQPKKIGADIDSAHAQIKAGIGYDHNWVLAKDTGLPCVAVARDPASGRRLRVYSDAPGLQFYTGNFMDGSSGGKGRVFQHRSAFCFEPQHFPDAVNQPHFPNCVLQVGEEYRHRMTYQFDLA